MVYCTCRQIESNGTAKLSGGKPNEVQQKEILLDFIYVKDVVKVIWWIYSTIKNNGWSSQNNGIYNLGTGKSRSQSDMLKAIFAALNKKPEITPHTEIPGETDSSPQHSTQATMVKLKHAGYEAPFASLEEGVEDYVKNYLLKKEYY